jgi:hypothetical protein
LVPLLVTLTLKSSAFWLSPPKAAMSLEGGADVPDACNVNKSFAISLLASLEVLVFEQSLSVPLPIGMPISFSLLVPIADILSVMAIDNEKTSSKRCFLSFELKELFSFSFLETSS